MTRRQSRIAGFVLMVMPCLGLVSLITSPRWEALRSIDVVQLLGTGACIGAGFILLLARPPKE
jgi:hypothetical protein